LVNGSTNLKSVTSNTEPKQPKSSNFQAYINTAKLFFGNAYLSIPNTFSYSGIVGGILMFSVVGAINCYTMM